MKITVFTSIFLLFSLFLAACSTDQTANQQQAANVETNANDALAEAEPIDEYWAKDNFDLQRVGPLLERSENLEEFEAYLNDEDGINNLDLNGDGYVDYISVDEFEDRTDNERGLSLYTRYDDDVIQELGTVRFYRDHYNAPGARILLTGDEHIYGPDHYYETNWLDRALGIVSFLFRPRDNFYRSPYYYDHYPPDYVAYEVVEPPIYISRVQRLYPEPVFVFTHTPRIVTTVTIDSPYDGRWIERVHARMVNPTREQLEFIRRNPIRRVLRDGPGRSEEATSRTGVPPGRPDDNPGRSGSAPGRSGDDRGRDDRGRSDDGPGRSDAAPGRSNNPPGRDNQPPAGRKNDGQPGKPANPPGKSDKPQGKPDNPGKGKPQGKGKP